MIKPAFLETQDKCILNLISIQVSNHGIFGVRFEALSFVIRTLSQLALLKIHLHSVVDCYGYLTDWPCQTLIFLFDRRLFYCQWKPFLWPSSISLPGMIAWQAPNYLHQQLHGPTTEATALSHHWWHSIVLTRSRNAPQAPSRIGWPAIAPQWHLMPGETHGHAGDGGLLQYLRGPGDGVPWLPQGAGRRANRPSESMHLSTGRRHGCFGAASIAWNGPQRPSENVNPQWIFIQNGYPQQIAINPHRYRSAIDTQNTLVNIHNFCHCAY